MRGGFAILKPFATAARRSTSAPTAQQLVSIIRKALDDNKAENIVVIDLSGKSSIADFMVIATGRSDRHVNALSDHVAAALREHGAPPFSIEGKETGHWVIVDSLSVLTHIFTPETRETYHLEKMWSVEMPEPVA